MMNGAGDGQHTSVLLDFVANTTWDRFDTMLEERERTEFTTDIVECQQ